MTGKDAVEYVSAASSHVIPTRTSAKARFCNVHVFAYSEVSRIISIHRPSQSCSNRAHHYCLGSMYCIRMG